MFLLDTDHITIIQRCTLREALGTISHYIARQGDEGGLEVV